MKKILSITLVIIVMLSVASVTASAKSVSSYNNTYISEIAENSSDYSDFNYRIRLAIVQRMVDETNAKIEALVYKAMLEKKPNIDKLVAQTNALAALTIKVAASLGIEVNCEYQAYVINGVTVYIDPLIVIKR